VSDVKSYPGRGVGGTVAGDRVLVGRIDLFEEQGWTVPAELRDRFGTEMAAGHLPALVGWEGTAQSILVAGDAARAGWEAVVEELATDRRIVVLTGDNAPSAAPFRDHPGIEAVFTGLPPEGKVATIRRLAMDGTVAMVGDGSNDAPALAAADVGIALASGTRLAADAADAVITTGDLAAVPRVFRLTVGARRRLRTNLGWAFLYNVIAVPLAALGLINPLLAAVAMASSSLVVVGNSARRIPMGLPDNRSRRD
ncbi:MAG: HAD-IC family P-type ATPase, partial [Halobacteriales archaeon]|nr:HAD-IC family P-type ATPase [Halobacteriales archaeon]